MSNHEVEPESSRNQKLSAALSALYAFELLIVDGARCADRTAPGSHLSGFYGITTQQLGYLAAQPKEVQSQKIEQAIALERTTARNRPADLDICQGGNVRI